MRIRTINEAAEALGVTGYRLRQGIQSGRYPSLKLGLRRLVDLDLLTPIIEAEEADRESWTGTGTICRLTGLRPGQIRRMCDAGQLPHKRNRSGRYRFQAGRVLAALEDMMERGDGDGQ